FGPIVENDLVEDVAALVVVEVVDLDEVHLLARHILSRRKTAKARQNANRRNKGSHRSPPCDKDRINRGKTPGQARYREISEGADPVKRSFCEGMKKKRKNWAGTSAD